MSTFMKINGAWKEGTPYLKEGGTWKEIGAVTAKANGKWADIKPPGPAVRTWTRDDFDITGKPWYGNMTYKIKSNLRQYFMVGDTLDIESDCWGYWSSPIPGIPEPKGKSITGTITGGTELTDVMEFENDNEYLNVFCTADGNPIPIKPAP